MHDVTATRDAELEGRMTRSWIDACAEVVDAADRAHVVAVLAAFGAPFPRGGPPAPPELQWPGDLVALTASVIGAVTPTVLVDDLAHDVDRGQAELFTRRLFAVDGFFAASTDPVAAVLRVGMHHRLAGIVRAARPHAPRVRALADFYYSHGSRRRHRNTDGVARRQWTAALAEIVWRDVKPGLARAVVEGVFDDGPVHVNLLRVDPKRVTIDVVDLREEAHAGVPFTASVERRGAIAATSGGFFLYSEPDIAPPSQRHDPVGLLVHRGEVLAPPVFRRAALWVDDRGGAHLDRIGLRDTIIKSPRGWQRTLDDATTRAEADVGPDAPSFAVVGARVIAVGERLAVPLNGFVAPTHGHPIEIGDLLGYAPIGAGGVRAAIAGGPMLVDGGRVAIDLSAEQFWGTAPPVTFSQDETGDHNLLPRLGVGRRGHELVFAAVDGRNFERALGMTLGDLAGLFVALGCERAMNLDGGSSKRMVVAGETLDLPSTEVVGEAATDPSVRPVYTAVLFFV